MHNLLKVSLGVCIASLVSGAHSQSNRIVNCLTTKGKLKIEVIITYFRLLNNVLAYRLIVPLPRLFPSGRQSGPHVS